MEIKVVETDQELQDAFQVRQSVFVEEQKVPAELEIDKHENEAVHFIAYDDAQPVAAGRFRTLEGMAKIERICVLGSYRRTGLGQMLMKEIERCANELKLGKLKLNAQVSAVAFYKKLGYHIISEEFMDAGIPHVTMTKDL